MTAPRRPAARGPRWPLALLLTGLSACSYQAGLAPKGLDGRPVERLGIDVFDNESRRPNLERDLHAALSGAARRWADTRLVRPETAEVVVRGRIVEADRLEGIRSKGNQIQETRETVRVEAELVDLLRGERVVRRASTFVFVGTTLDVADAEVDARARAIQVAADRLLLILLARPDEEAAPALEAAGLPIDGR